MLNSCSLKRSRFTPCPVYTNRYLGWFLLLALLGSLMTACEPRFDKDLLEKLVKMEKPLYKGKPVSEEALSAVRVILKEYHALQTREKQAAVGQPQKEADLQMRFVEKIGMLYYKLGVDYLEIDQLRQQESLQVEQKSGVASSFREMPPDELLTYHIALAIRLMAKGMYWDALSSLESVLSVFPNNERLFYYAGLCAANLGKACVTDEQASARANWYQKAYTYYSKANTLESHYPEAQYALAILLAYELDRQDEAEAWLLKLLAVEKNNAKAYFLLGSLYYKQNRLDEALKQYQAAKEVVPDDVTKAQAEDNITRIKGELDGK